jgi:cell division protease FtsH
MRKTPLGQYAADHRHLLKAVARAAGFDAPVAIDADKFHAPLIKRARKGPLLPIDGLLVRDCDPDNRRISPGTTLGARIYHIEGIRFVSVHFAHSDWYKQQGLEFLAVDRKDYHSLYRIALRCRRDFEPSLPPPILPRAQAELFWRNTIGYLEPANLRRIRKYGGRARRGVLLMGPPGNGKTSACRWVWEECRRRNWEWRLVTPDLYVEARKENEVQELFTVGRRGIVFFDDMDLALRDRETVHETDNQSVFLNSLDGIQVNEGVVFVFTSNCPPELIDRAFKRPGRLDLVIHFKPPDDTLRRQLILRWHPEIVGSLDMQAAVASTAGYSFAEIEELKNLLIMRFMDTGSWEWAWAMEQFRVNRTELNAQRRRVGFEPYEAHTAAALLNKDSDGGQA